MDDDFEYEPKLFDIRVKPPGKDDAKKGDQECEWDGCVTKGDCKAPQSPDKINEFFYFCKKHAAQYNKTWNFFHGMSDGAVRSYQADQATGNRPTWNMNRNLDGKGVHAKGGRFKDTFGIMGEKVSGEVDERKRSLGRLQSLAMDTLGLDYDSGARIIRARYLKLVKQYHPDANKGDRSTEERLQQVIRAYQVLKTSRLA